MVHIHSTVEGRITAAIYYVLRGAGTDMRSLLLQSHREEIKHNNSSTAELALIANYYFSFAPC